MMVHAPPKMTRLLTIIILLAACACDDLGDAADDWAETETEFRSDVTVCVDRETNECRLDQSPAGCLVTEVDACSTQTYSPRACHAQGANCYGVWVGDGCTAPFEDACNFF